jgi:signal transduction histidine kinase
VKRTLALALGVALPTILLSLGWLWSTVRERDGLRREHEARLARSAGVVRAAVDASLEELRRAEDDRPFYLYNHYYSPPDVLAVSDPVAISPLARPPVDPRVVGWFQIDPDGTVRTPHAPSFEVDVPDGLPGLPSSEERAEGVARADRVRGLVESVALATLRGDIRGDANNPALVPAVADAGVPDAGPAIRELLQAALEAPADEEEEEAVSQPGIGDNAGLTPEGPLTVSLDDWGTNVYNDVAQAYVGDPEANWRVQQRGRSAPITRRNVVSQAQAQREVAATGSSAPPRKQRAARLDARPRRRPRPPGDPATTVSSLPLPVVRRGEADIDYTEMAWLDRPSSTLLLHRIVSHEGAAVVQGVVLDRDHVVGDWLPAVVRRHAEGDEVPAVVTGPDAECALRAPAASTLSGVDLCFPPASLAGAVASADADLRIQAIALAGLLLVVLIAVLVIHRASRRADELSRQKSAFVSAVSHELRTPLTTIRMHAEMLRDGMVPDRKRDRFHGDLVNESVRLSRLVENVLEISRIEEGRRPFRPRPGDLVQHVRAILAEQRPFVVNKGFELVGPLRADPVELEFDHQAVEQIVVNLVDNAVKYARGDDQRVEVEVEVEESRAVIAVRDRGPGIPEAERRRVFDRFHRVERVETAHMPGTGIGLSLVRDLALAHGGEPEVRERPGGGTEIRVGLPMRR